MLIVSLLKHMMIIYPTVFRLNKYIYVLLRDQICIYFAHYLHKIIIGWHFSSLYFESRGWIGLVECTMNKVSLIKLVRL